MNMTQPQIRDDDIIPEATLADTASDKCVANDAHAQNNHDNCREG